MDAKALYDYAARYFAENDARWPTVRMAAQKFRRTHAAVVDAVEGAEDARELGGEYFGVAGWAEDDRPGDLIIEAY
jgi:hypothetical protein